MNGILQSGWIRAPVLQKQQIKQNQMQQEPGDYDDYFKVIVVGDSGTGKTNIVQTYDKGVRPERTVPTVGIDYCSKLIKIDNTRKVKMQIWDTAGQENYRAVTMSHYRNAVGALVVFDVTNRNSFQNVTRWINDIRERANENCVIGITGNKIDLDRRAVSRDQGENLASREHAFYAETTAMDVNTIRAVFDRLGQQVYRTGKTKNLEFSRTNVDLDYKSSSGNKQENNCKC